MSSRSQSPNWTVVDEDDSFELERSPWDDGLLERRADAVDALLERVRRALDRNDAELEQSRRRLSGHVQSPAVFRSGESEARPSGGTSSGRQLPSLTSSSRRSPVIESRPTNGERRSVGSVRPPSASPLVKNRQQVRRQTDVVYCQLCRKTVERQRTEGRLSVDRRPSSWVRSRAATCRLKRI
jgi:hypothetical protein